MNELNWGNTHLILPNKERETAQKFYQERYGDLLTKHIKLAKKNARRIAANKLKQSQCGSKVKVESDDELNATSSLSLAILEEGDRNDYSLPD